MDGAGILFIVISKRVSHHVCPKIASFWYPRSDLQKWDYYFMYEIHSFEDSYSVDDYFSINIFYSNIQMYNCGNVIGSVSHIVVY